MSNPSTDSRTTQAPPPGPDPDAPTPAQLYDAAAYVTALAYHHRAQLSKSSMPLAQPDLYWLLFAHVDPAFKLAGVYNDAAAKCCVLRLVLSALRQAAMVRAAELGGYLEAITAGQQQHLLALAHRYLSDQ